MAKNTKNSLCHSMVMRRNLKKILEGYQKSKFIYRFERLLKNGSISNNISYSIYLEKERMFMIHLFPSESYSNEIRLGEDFGKISNILLGSLCKVKKVKTFLYDEIKTRKDGLKTEKLFLNQVKEFNFLSISQAPAGNDIRGVDFFILYQGYNIPLQLKSSVLKQRIHKIKFPSIPSLVYSEKFFEDYNKLKLVILKILNAFKKGEILHL